MFPSAHDNTVEQLPDGTYVRHARSVGVIPTGLPAGPEPDDYPSWDDVDTYRTSHVEALETLARAVADHPDVPQSLRLVARRALAQ